MQYSLATSGSDALRTRLSALGAVCAHLTHVAASSASEARAAARQCHRAHQRQQQLIDALHRVRLRLHRVHAALGAGACARLGLEHDAQLTRHEADEGR